MSDMMRAEFENSPRFKGMDFTRSSTHPEYYESPYANGAWDGWKASREALVIQLPALIGEDHGGCSHDAGLNDQAIIECRQAIEAAGLKVKTAA